jgi:predicted transcriptional regulator
MAKKISDEIINQIPILYEQLKNKSEVARQLGISAATVNKYLTVIAAAPQEVKKERKKRVKVTDELIQQINEEYTKLKNMKKVAEITGVSTATVKKYLSEENLLLSKTLNDNRDALWYYIYRLFGQYSEDKPVSDWNVTQMMKFKNQGMTYKGQLLTLKYFFEIKKSSIEKSNGSIGIIPWIYSEAAEYYAQKEKEQKAISDAIKAQLEKDRVEIKYNPSNYINKKKKKKEIDLNSI